MKRKGFTLIELLAVIIILAIIALIATPIILNVIEDARKSAGKSEASMILSGINNYCATSEMKNQLDGSIDICNDTDGVTKEDVSQMVSLGNAKILEVEYSNGKVTKLKVKSNNYEIELQPDGSFSVNGETATPEDPVDPTPEEPEGKSLISTLLEQVGTKGLVQDENNSNIYYYKGNNEEVSNNYLWYGGHHWRIMEIDTSANTMLLISQQPLTSIQPSLNVWQTQEEYEASYINNWLNEYFYNTLADNVKNNIISNTFNVGIWNNVDEITTIQKVGLLDYDQYKRAGKTDSYLDIKDSFWLGNRDDEIFIEFVMDNGGYGSNYYPSFAFGVRAVIKIPDMIIAGGTGTLESNYEIGDKATNISESQIGEYVNVPYSGSDNACGTDNKCTFRIIGKDNDSVKIVLNGTLPDGSQFGPNNEITTTHPIYTKVNSFATGISNNYRYIGNKNFYVGGYSFSPSQGQNYETVKNATFSSNIGLITVGEMFSGNDIDLSTSNVKTFVDINTIENASSSNSCWTIAKDGDVGIRFIKESGELNFDAPPYVNGVRPVIFLKNNLTFTGGKGTAQSPYELS